jgi:hypothetical protein
MEAAMPDETQKDEKIASPITDLPTRVEPKAAENIKGGALLRGGDDDLDDLEVER